MADKISINLGQLEGVVNIKTLLDEQKLNSIVKTIENALSNVDIKKYLKGTDDLLNDLQIAFSNFNKEQSKVNAKELLNVSNVLKALGVDISDVIPEFDKINSAISQAGKLAHAMDGVINVKQFKDAAVAIAELSENGVNVAEMFERLGTSADTNALKKQIDDLSDSLENAGRKIEKLRDRNSSLSDELYKVKSGSRVTELEEQLEELRSLRDRTVEEFKQSLGYFGFDEHQFDLDPYIKNIEEGVYSAKGALADFKSDYRYLFEDAFNNKQNTGTDQFDKLESSLTEVLKVVQETSAGIKELQNQIDMFSVPGIEDDFKGSDESLKQILDLFGQINDSLSSLRSVISDVGDGEEFSPLLKTIKEITTAVDTLSKSVSNISLNVNIESGGMDQKLLSSLDAKKQSLLSAYKTQFDAMRAFKPSGATVAKANPENRSRIAALNKQINNFDGGASTDNIDQRITAFKEVIKLMKEVSQLSYGKDIYSDMDSSFKNAVSSATGQVTRVQNELKKANTDVAGLENIFGSQDLSKVIEQLGRIADQFENIAKAASEFKAKFADGIKVESSVQEIETLTKKVKELEEEISKLKTGSETNISTPKNTTPDAAGASAEDSKVAIEGEGKAADEAGKSFNKASQAKQEFVDVNKKVKQSAESSADAVKKEAEAAKQVDFTPNTEGFDEIVAKFKYLEQYRDQIEKLVKISKKNKDGSYDVSYNARLKSGTTVDLGESSTPQILKANEVAFNAKDVAQATKEAEKEAAALTEVNKALSDTKSKLYDFADGNEKLQASLANDNWTQQFGAIGTDIDVLNQKLQNQEITAKQYGKEIDDLLSKEQKRVDALISSYKERDNAFENVKKEGITQATKEAEKEAAANKLQSLRDSFGNTDIGSSRFDQLFPKIESQIKGLNTSLDKGTISVEKYREEIERLLSTNVSNSISDSMTQAIDEQKSQLEKATTEMQKVIDDTANKIKTGKPVDGMRSSDYSTMMDKYKAELEELRTLQATVSKQDYVSAAQLKQFDDLRKKLKDSETSFKTLSAAEKGSTVISREKLYSKIGEYLQKNSGMAKEFKVQLKALQKQLENDGPNANVSDLTAQFIRLQSQIREAGQEGRSFLDVLKDKAFYGFVGQLSTYFGFNDFVRYIGEGVNTIRELDTAMTEMRKVSDESVTSLKNFQKESFDIANAVGTTALQIQNSTADWMRLGLSLEDAKEAAKDANILLNVSEFDNIEDATKSLVSMSQAYKDLDKLTIVDKLNEVGNNYAISTDELASALQRSSATLSLMGNTIDEAAALVTTANATIQDADSVAAGLRTISLRLVGTSEAEEELSAMNEEVDAFVKATNSKKQQIIKDYTAVASNQYKGFDILDDNGNYKNTYEILLGIAKVYKEIQEQDKKLGTNHAMALIEELAGKNRSNIASAILQDPKQLEEVLKSSQEANGSALEELNKQLESVDGRIQKLTNRCQEFWATVIDTDTVKTGISLLTDLVSGATALVDKLGTLPTALGALGAALSVKNVGGRKMFRLLNMPTA